MRSLGRTKAGGFKCAGISSNTGFRLMVRNPQGDQLRIQTSGHKKDSLVMRLLGPYEIAIFVAISAALPCVSPPVPQTLAGVGLWFTGVVIATAGFSFPLVLIIAANRLSRRERWRGWHGIEHRAAMLIEHELEPTAANLRRLSDAGARCGTAAYGYIGLMTGSAGLMFMSASHPGSALFRFACALALSATAALSICAQLTDGFTRIAWLRHVVIASALPAIGIGFLLQYGGTVRRPSRRMFKEAERILRRAMRRRPEFFRGYANRPS